MKDDDYDLLGLLYDDLNRLRDCLEKLDQANKRLDEANIRMKEVNGRLANAVNRLKEANTSLEVSLSGLSEVFIVSPTEEASSLPVQVKIGQQRGTVVPIRERRRKKSPLAPADEAQR